MALFLQLDRKNGGNMKFSINLLIGLYAMALATYFLERDFDAIATTGFEPIMLLRFLIIAIVAIYGWWQIRIYWKGPKK